jgi:hypothetical protein
MHLALTKMAGRCVIRGGSPLGVPLADLNEDCRGLRAALQHLLAGQHAFLVQENDDVDKPYRCLIDQLACCCANASPLWPPSAPDAALTGHTDAG